MKGDPHTTTATIFAQTADAATADPHRVFSIRDLFECCDPCKSVSHPIANSLRKCGFLIPPQRMWMFLGIRCDVLAVARIVGVTVHPVQKMFAVFAEVQRSASFCFNRAVGQRIRVPQLCVCATCDCFFSVLICATGMPIRCNKHDAETSFFGQGIQKFFHAPLPVHEPSCEGCVPCRTSVVVAPCFFPACSVNWVPCHSLATSQFPPLGRASFHERFDAHCCTCRTCARWPTGMHSTSPPPPSPPQRSGPILSISSFCFTVLSLSYVVLENHLSHFAC